MRATALAVIVPMVLSAAALAAEGDDGLKFEGSIGLGAIVTNTSASTKDEAKLNEYRDLRSGALSYFDIKGRGDNRYLDMFGENLGRDDQYLDVRGGQYLDYKYRVYDNRIIHNRTFNAITPYSGVGTATLDATFPNTNTDTWNRFDFATKRDNIGAMLEVSRNSPWFFRMDANEVRDKGLKLIGGSNGTSPGNGFTDKPFPVDFATRNISAEGGYASKAGQLSVNVLHSTFSNENELLHWKNPFFGPGASGTLFDTTTLPPDNETNKISVNGNLRQLPLGSTIAGRITYAKTTNNFDILSTILSVPTTGGAAVDTATTPNRSTFDGEVVHKTASLSVYSNPSQTIDTRVYWYEFKKDNRSPTVTFSPSATSNLQCSGANCVTEILSFDKTNIGTDVGYRINRTNRLVFGVDYVDLNRDRVDFDETKDWRETVEYKNTSLDSLTARAKYQHLQRRSHFLEGESGTSANDPEFLNRFIARFDASNVDQDLFKIGMDATPAELWDVGIEGIIKHNDYKDTFLGRTKDNRQELFLSVGYGDIKKFRVLLFADVEYIQYDSLHRNISTVSSGSGAAPNNTPSGFCQSTAPNCYDPNTAPTNSNYNWDATNKDRNYAFGLGADWAATQRWKFSSSLLFERTYGTVDFAVQAGANPTVPQVPIGNYDNTRRLSFNLKSTYKHSEQLEFTGGYAYDKFRFSDIAYDGFQYTIPSGTSTSYLSGAYAFPNFIARSFYFVSTYKF